MVRIDNSDRFVRATKIVVLATGGFAMNAEMLALYAPLTRKLRDPIGVKDDGAGIMLGIGAGDDSIHIDEFFTTCPWTIPESQSNGVYVNVAGQRFINAGCYRGRVSRAEVDQPGSKVYLLFDSAHFTQPFQFARVGIAGSGDTWEEVETELGMPAGTLVATMAFYDAHASEGSDPLFGKRPPILTPLDQAPFVALELNFETSYFSFFTLGGLRTSVEGEVIGATGRRSPGFTRPAFVARAIIVAVSARPASLISAMTTSAPFSANSLAVARPIPDAAPVTIIGVPLNRTTLSQLDLRSHCAIVLRKSKTKAQRLSQVSLESLDARVWELEDERAIRELKARYLHACDLKDIDGVRDTLPPEGAVIEFEGFPRFADREPFVQIYRETAARQGSMASTTAPTA